MKERPILFSGQMVRAIMDGRKSQTRRLNGLQRINACTDQWSFEGINVHGEYLFYDRRDPGILTDAEQEECIQVIKCPYGQPGDWLWVKETYLLRGNGTIATYKADMPDVEAAGFGAMYGGWKSGRFMPKRWSRLMLEITGIRVEKVQDISEADAIAEGVRCPLTTSPHGHDASCSPVALYSDLWRRINGPDSWTANPLVWVLEFKKV
jgi:hypothetical protein